jgi:hypothetical protein
LKQLEGSVKKFVGLFALCVAVSLGASTLISSSQDQSPKAQALKTQKQKEHGKLFKHGGKTLADLLGGQSGDITVAADPPLEFDSDASKQNTPSLESSFCNADAVVVGTLGEESAYLNEDESFIFTEYQLNVSEVVRNNKAAPIKINDNVTVVRDGGTLSINGRVVRALTADFKPFKTGEQYVLFLRYLPTTGSYLAYLYGSFLLDKDTVRTFGNVPPFFASNSQEFLGRVRATATTKCVLPK